METRLHLISAPWLSPDMSSIQIASLKAYSDMVFKDRVKSFCYSAHFQIPLGAEDSIWPSYYNRMFHLGESAYLILLYRNFIATNSNAITQKQINNFLKKVSRTELRLYGSLLEEDTLTVDDLYKLEISTNKYIDSHLIPNFTSNGINVVGFSLNYDQTYASIYIEKYLQKKFESSKLLFLYGGYCASDPIGIKTLLNSRASGYSVVGEGEKKLEIILQQLLDSPPQNANEIILNVEGVKKPIEFENIFEFPKSYFKSQIQNINTLPLPNHDEFFESYNVAYKKFPLLKANLYRPTITVEGTRGCFAKCDFCALNAQWEGFRNISAENIFNRVSLLSDKYKCYGIYFVDNVCDTWAKKFSDLARKDINKISYVMSNRAHHNEDYWTILSLGGLKHTQIGVEALSQPLLKEMGKGTTVIQNLKAQKYICELEIGFRSGLITHHPKSTEKDVIETKRVIKSIIHFQPFKPSPFRLEAHSRIFNELSKSQVEKLKYKNLIKNPKPLEKFLTDCVLLIPKSFDIKPSLKKQWDEFTRWYYKQIRVNFKKHLPTMTVNKLEDGSLLIKDRRTPRLKKIRLKGDSAQIYNLCHHGLTLQGLTESLGLDEKYIRNILNSMLKKKILLKCDKHYLSIALRPRSELINNLNDKS